MKRGEKINAIIGFPRSIYWNIKLFGLHRGIKFPILLGKKCKIHISKNAKIQISAEAGFGSIKIGVNVGPFEKGSQDRTIFNVQNEASMVFKGKCNINSGSVINITSGTCILGTNFAANSHFLLSCEKEIIIGDNVLFGWDCTVIDGDGHEIRLSNGNTVTNSPRPIDIGDHVWIASHSSILKGVKIPPDSVIGYGSIISKSFEERETIIVGSPGRIVKRGVSWIR